LPFGSWLGLVQAAYLPLPTTFEVKRAAMQAGDPEPDVSYAAWAPSRGSSGTAKGPDSAGLGAIRFPYGFPQRGAWVRILLVVRAREVPPRGFEPRFPP
jgi:hypothetical protein